MSDKRRRSYTRKHGKVSTVMPLGEIPVFLACPDVDPMHSPKIGNSLCSQYLVSQ